MQIKFLFTYSHEAGTGQLRRKSATGWIPPKRTTNDRGGDLFCFFVDSIDWLPGIVNIGHSEHKTTFVFFVAFKNPPGHGKSRSRPPKNSVFYYFWPLRVYYWTEVWLVACQINRLDEIHPIRPFTTISGR